MAGIAFPFKKGAKNFPDTNTGDKTVVDSFVSLLQMGEYELPLGGGIGSNTHSFVFKFLTPLVKARIINSIRRLAELYEPRIVVLAVDVYQGSKPRDKNVIYAEIQYRVDQLGGSFSTQVGMLQGGVI